MKSGYESIGMVYAKKIVSKQDYKNLKKINDVAEKFSALRYSILNGLDRKYSLLDAKIKFLKSKGFDVIFANNYLSLFGTKIAYLKHHLSEDSLKRTLVLLDKTEKEVKKIYV